MNIDEQSTGGEFRVDEYGFIMHGIGILGDLC